MIFGIGGKLSGGKTCTSVMFAHEKFKEGKKVIANFNITFPEDPESDRVIFMRNDQIVDFIKGHYQDQESLRSMFYNSVLILDEIGQLISARASSTALNQLMTGFFMMAGKLDCDVLFTFQVKESMVDKILREVCNVYANCYRVTSDGEPLIFDSRIYPGKIAIVVVLEFDFDIMGMKYGQLVYDPTPYYAMYDTREITLLDRSLYLRGGSRDLRK